MSDEILDRLSLVQFKNGSTIPLHRWNRRCPLLKQLEYMIRGGIIVIWKATDIKKGLVYSLRGGVLTIQRSILS